VTGLTVIDPGVDLTAFGQFVLVLLIQLGGLGILSLSAFVILTLRQGEEMQHRLYVEMAHGGVRGVTPLMVLREVVGATLLVEATGAVLLFVGIGRAQGSFDFRAAWSAVFHAVSAFCNAGFSLYSKNLEIFRDSAVVSLVIMVLIVAGGIGFTVLADLVRFVQLPRRQRRWWRLSLHSRLVLATTAVLIVGGAVLFALFEWENTLRGVPPSGRILAPFFYSVTCRTAGFNTTPTGSLTAPSLMLGIMLMFIGASPGGTGGGVKTTSAAVLSATAISRARNRPHVECMGRTIPGPVVAKAIATVAAFVVVLLLAAFGLQLTEIGLQPHDRHPALSLDYAYETVSAIGTVGLSTGITSKLSTGGKLILIALMYIGRTGPLVIGASVIGRGKVAQKELPEEEVIVG
jgi:trk system potassium uptake protein TrkH